MDLEESITSKPIESDGLAWTLEASEELNRIPGFVRGKVKRNGWKWETKFSEGKTANRKAP